MDELNEQQQKAVETTEGYVRVIAGAGSGKTKALTERFLYLVEELDIPPANILCATFTNKAANEMRERIHALTGDADTGYICTFHSFCISVLQEDSYAISYPKSFLVIDNADIDDMLKVIYEERNLSLRDCTFTMARDMFEMRKCVEVPLYYQDLMNMSTNQLEEKYRSSVELKDILFYGYLYQEKKCFALDYNDLIIFVLHIFDTHADIRLKWQKRLEYIMVDEFQDIDPLQYRLMEALCGYHHNLFVVGDPDQTIYTWRGANIRFLLDFGAHFSPCTTIRMDENYRSTPQILQAVNDLIDHNTVREKKALVTGNEAGPKPVYYHAKSAAEECEWIGKEIQRLHEQGGSYGDMAVLYRAHYVTRNLEEGLMKEKVPFVIYSGVPFYNRMEIKDALCYLRMVVQQDDLSFRRVCNVPKRNLGRQRLAFLEEQTKAAECTLYEALCQNIDNEIFRNTKAKGFIALIDKYSKLLGELSLSQLASQLLDESGYETMLRTEGSQTRLDNLAEWKQSLYEYEKQAGEETDAVSYLRSVALNTSADAELGNKKVKLMTVHTAKGLEFPVVFLCGMNEGIFPSRKTKTVSAMEEERRLAFVAMTRAEKQLYLTEAEGTNLDNGYRYPSRFVLEIPEGDLDIVKKPSESLVKKAKENMQRVDHHLVPEVRDLPFAAGDRILHRHFGPGTILSLNQSEESITIQFDALDTPRDIAIQAARKLQKIV